MDRGTETEPLARAAYEFMTDNQLRKIGFADHPSIPMAGASPDGLVAVLGLVEIKCPETHTHLDTLLGKPIAKKYITQMQWQMACTERNWCDWVSFDPRLPINLQLFVQRVNRDDVLIGQLEAEVADFLSEIDQIITDLTTRYYVAKHGEKQ